MQRRDDILKASETLFGAALLVAGLAFAGSAAVAAQRMDGDYLTVACVVATAFAFELLPVSLPGNRKLTVLALPVVLAAALLAWPIAAVAVLGGSLIGLAFSRPMRVVAIAHSLLASAIAAAAAYGAGFVELGPVGLGRLGAVALIGAAASAGWVALNGRRNPWMTASGVRGIASLDGLSQACMGVAAAVVLPVGGVASVGVLLLLALVLQYGFQVLMRAKLASVQTLRAVVWLSEQQEGGNVGHAERVAELAGQLASKLSMHSSERSRVVLAALLHDIGYLSLDPSDHDLSDRDLADAGADALSRMPALSEYAPVVALTGLPWSENLEPTDFSARAAAIIRVASALDLYNLSSQADGDPSAFLRVRSGTVFDPAVVGAALDLQ